MPEEPAVIEEHAEPQQASKGPESKPWQPPASADELNTIIEKRLARERATHADYDDLKAKAAKFDEIEQAGKTQAQKDADEITALKTELAAAQDAQLRAEVASAKGVPVANLSGKTREELEASADALLAWKGPARKEPLPTGSGSDVHSSPDMSAEDIVKAATKR